MQVTQTPAPYASKVTRTLVAVSNAVQHIVTTGVPSDGSFLLTWPGYQTVEVPYDCPHATLQPLLDTVFGADNTVASDGPLPAALNVAFQGALAGVTVPLPTIDDRALVPAVAPGSPTPHAVVTVTAPGGGDVTLLAEDASREAFLVSANVADVWLSYGTAAAEVGVGHCVRKDDPPFREGAWKNEVHVISAGAAVVGCTELKYAVGDDEGERPTGADAWVPSGPSDAPIPPPTAPPPGTPLDY